MDPPFTAYCGIESFVFVSYAHKDKHRIYPIIERLDQEGVRIWYDEGIPAASNWIETIAATLIRCELFMLFISPQILESVHVRDEISFAKKQGKPIIPIYLEATELSPELEFQLGNFQALFIENMSEERFWRKLKEAVVSVNALRCPECSGSLSEVPKLGKKVVCSYCGTTFMPTRSY